MLMNPIVSEALGPFWLIAFQCPLGIPIYLFYLVFGWEGVGSRPWVTRSGEWEACDSPRV